MSRDVRIEAAARDELAAAVEWYEEQRPGLGDELLDEVEASLQQISSAPLVNLAVPGCPPDSPARRVLLRRFPYSVVYLLTDAEIHVIAFAHPRIGVRTITLPVSPRAPVRRSGRVRDPSDRRAPCRRIGSTAKSERRSS